MEEICPARNSPSSRPRSSRSSSGRPHVSHGGVSCTRLTLWEHSGMQRVLFTEDTKKCSACKKQFPVTGEYFIRNRTRKDGFDQFCKRCRADASRRYYLKYPDRWKANAKRWAIANPERHRSNAQRWCERNPEKWLYQTARNRAKKSQIPFDIELTDIHVPDMCPYLGIPITTNRGHGLHDGSPSVDRIDPSLGYIKGNVEVISYRANTLKNNGTASEHMKIAIRMMALLGDRV